VTTEHSKRSGRKLRSLQVCHYSYVEFHRAATDRLCLGTGQIFNVRPSAVTANAPRQLKLVILDEVDSMEYAAQMALRRTMEDYAFNARFCIITNHIQRLSPALVSRCAKFHFKPLSSSVIKSRILKIIRKESIAVEPEAVEGLALLSKGDMRQAVSMLQKCSLQGEG
jgi:DNA polymerase III delta prime subunit